MADHIIFRRLVLILFQELCSAGECDLGNIFLYLVSRHSDAIVCELQRLFFWIYLNLDAGLIDIPKLVFTHHIQFLKLRNRVAAIGYHFAHENIMV